MSEAILIGIGQALGAMILFVGMVLVIWGRRA